ncbi:MAG: FAD:protein FMN transferase [Mycoplasmatales bacterium]
MKKYLYLLIVSTFILAGCSKVEDIYELEYFYFDVPINIKIYNEDHSIKPKTISTIKEDIDKLLSQIETDYSIQRDGMLTDINNVKDVEVNDDFEYLFNLTNKACEYTDGYYDPTSGAITQSWDFDENVKPSQEQIDKALSTVDCNSIQIKDHVLHKDKDTKIDLGSVNKGYAANQVKLYLEEHDITSALINMGGNIQAVGKKNNQEEYTIAIKDPSLDNITNETIGNIKVSNSAVVTSGLYERNFEEDGVLYYHILDSKTGYPVKTDLVSTTIICKDGELADLLSTTTFILGVDKSLELINNLDGVEAILIDKDNNIYTSSKNIQIEDLNSKFNIKENPLK